MESDQNKDFLLQWRPVTRLQLVGLLLGALFLLIISFCVAEICITKFREAPDLVGVILLIVGFPVCMLFLYLAWLNVRRIFLGKGPDPIV
jgi:hypothetical protein